MDFGKTSPSTTVMTRGKRMVNTHPEKSPKMLDETFWIKILTMMLRMMIVMSKSRGELKSFATSCLRRSLSERNTFTFIDERENRAASDVEKNAENTIKAHKKKMRAAITAVPFYLSESISK